MPQSCGQQLQVATPLADDVAGQQVLAKRLYAEFHAMRTYGKEPESLESILPLFQNAVAKYPIQKILAALDLHASRSQEFPTRYDIVNLLKRGGRPPLSESMAVQISRKDPEERTDSDWAYMREFEAFQKGNEWNDDDAKVIATQQENYRLRQQVKELKTDNDKAWEEVRKLRIGHGIEKQRPSEQEKINPTIAQMRSSGASVEDIEEFEKSMRIAA